MNCHIMPIKAGILKHIDEWISTLGKLLEQTAWERLEKITYKVEDYSSRLKEIRHSSELERTLVLISDIWEMTLEFEIDYMDIQERCRTLDMYGIKSEKNIGMQNFRFKFSPLGGDRLYLKRIFDFSYPSGTLFKEHLLG